MFFKNEDNAKVLASFLRKSEAAHVEDKSRAERLSISRQIIGYIYKSPEGWDERCTFNISISQSQHILIIFTACPIGFSANLISLWGRVKS